MKPLSLGGGGAGFGSGGAGGRGGVVVVCVDLGWVGIGWAGLGLVGLDWVGVAIARFLPPRSTNQMNQTPTIKPIWWTYLH
jgi:hypothetical protein